MSSDMENSDSQAVFTDAQPVPKRKCLEVLPPIPTEMKPNDQYYSMKSTDRGLAVIFSHESYDEIDGKKIEPRHGTSIDVEKLSCTFSDLGFTIDVQEDKTYEEIIDHISQVSRMNELKKYDCLVVFVLTHGNEHEKICAKDKPYYVKELVEPFTGRNCIHLANKPKLFFIQACKGVKSQKGITLRTMTDSVQVSGANKTYVMYSIPEISDVLVSYATIEGYTALRDEKLGTPYVKCLCEALDSDGTTEDLLTLLIRVHHRLSTSVYRLKDMENSASQDVFTDSKPVPRRKCLEVLSQIPTELNENDLYYSMKSTDRGLAVIFNHESYDEIDGKKLPPRHGTSIDVEKLYCTFSGLGFTIDVQEDKTYEEIINYISKVSRMNELKKYDCLVVFVLTHGNEHEKICAKDKPYYVKELVEPFTGRNCIHLANKPKLFFIQACKGLKSQKGITLRTMTDSVQVSGANKTYVMYSIPEISDVLVSYATIEGYTALRDATAGTPYVTCLCEALDSDGTKEDLLTLLIRVHHRLSTSVYRLNGSNQVKMQPSFLCYLNRFVRFAPPPLESQTQ